MCVCVGTNQNNNFFITLHNYYQGTKAKYFLNDDRNTFFFSASIMEQFSSPKHIRENEFERLMDVCVCM